MALDFSAGTTDNCDFGSDSSLDDLSTGTFIAWVRPTAVSGDDTIYAKNNSSFTAFHNWLGNDGSGNILLDVRRTGPNLQVLTSNGPLSANTWSFIACVFDTGGANGDQKHYSGGLSSAPTEDTYTTQQVGSGTKSSEAGVNAVIGNVSTPQTWGTFGGRIAFMGVWDRVLTLEEITAQWRKLHPTANCQLFCHVGLAGTGTQVDLSGNGNDGTVTGATKADHVPIVPYPFVVPWVVVPPSGNFTQSASGTLTSSGATNRKTSTTLAGALSSAGAIGRKILIAIAGGLSISGVLPTVATFTQSVAGTLSTSGAVGVKALVALAGALTSSGAVNRKTIIALSGALSSAGSLGRKTLITLAGALTSAGALSTDLITGLFTQSVSGTLTTSGTVGRKVFTTLSGALSSAGALGRKTLISLVGTLTSAGALSTNFIAGFFTQSVSGTLTTSGTLGRKTLTTLAGVLTSVGTVGRNIFVSLAGTLTSSGTLAAAITFFTTIGGTLTSSGALGRKTIFALAGTLTTSGSVGRKIFVTVSGILSSAATAIGTLLGLGKIDVAVSDSAVTAVSLSDSAVTTVTLSDFTRG